MRFEATVEKVNTKALKIGRETEIVLTVDTYRSLVADMSLLVNSRVTIELNPQQYEMSIDVTPSGDKELVPVAAETEDVGEQVAEAISAPCANCGHEEASHSGENGCCINYLDDGFCGCTEYVRPETIDILTGAILGTEPGGAEDDEAGEVVEEIPDEDGPLVEDAVADGLTVDDMIASALTQVLIEQTTVLSGGVVG